MSKNKIYLLCLFMVFALVLIPFQNCGQEFKVSEELSMSQSSVEEVDIPFTEGHGDIVTESVKAETSYEPILVDRQYLKALLTDIFGPLTSSIISLKIFNNASEFGSPCSIYGNYTQYDDATKKRYTVDLDETCSTQSNNFLNAPLHPKSSVTRQSIITRACSDLTTDSRTLGYALQKISTDAIPAANQTNVIKLFNLFYRDKGEPPQSLTDSLLVMFPQNGVTLDHWRIAIYTVCISNFWQVL